MPFNRRKHVGKWGTEVITVNSVPIVVPKQPGDKRHFKVWNRMLKQAKSLALLGFYSTKTGFALPRFPAKDASPAEKREWQRWQRVAWTRGNPSKLRQVPSQRRYHRRIAGTKIPEDWHLDLMAERAAGKTVAEIAARYECSEATMGTHLRNAENSASSWLLTKINQLMEPFQKKPETRRADLSRF